MSLFDPTYREASFIAMWLDERIQSRIDCQGGYPDVFQIIGNKLVIASVDYRGGPCLETYTKKQALEQACKECSSYDEANDVSYFEDDAPPPYNGHFVSATDILEGVDVIHLLMKKGQDECAPTDALLA